MTIPARAIVTEVSQDVRYALRAMRRTPGFTAVAIVTLALGIGANTAIFSVAYAVLLRPLPYANPDRLVTVVNRWDGRPAAALSDPEYLDYSERSRTLVIAASATSAMVISGAGGGAERVSGAYVTTNAFDVLAVRPAAGRAFNSDEGGRDGARVVILTDGFWKRRFAANPAIVGTTLSVDGELCDVVGVAPRGFMLPLEFGAESPIEIIRPLGLDRVAPRNQRGGHYLQAFARLAPGVDIGRARAEMAGVISSLVREYQQPNLVNFGLEISPLRDDLLGAAGPVLIILSIAVALVLLMACVNVANLLLARGEARRRELAVRSALGASRFRLVRQMLTEAWLLSGVGALSGLMIAVWCQRLIVSFAPRGLPRVTDASLNGPVLACAAVLGIVAGLLFGLIPARHVHDAGSADSLKDGARGTDSRSALWRTLVVAQVAIAAVLLVGAGLLVKSFVRLMSVKSGFSSDHVLTFRISLPEARYPGRPEVTTYFERLLDRMLSLPGVESAGAGSGLPLAVTSGDWSFDVEGRPLLNGKHSGAADWYVVTPGYFETLGVQVVKGRATTRADVAGAQPVLVINETTARTLFPGEDPIGKRVRFSKSRGFEQPWRTIVGIVVDVRQQALDVPPRPEVYFPHPQFQHFVPNAQARAMTVVLKTPADPVAMSAVVREEVRRLDPEVPPASLRDMKWIVGNSMRDRRLTLFLIGGFGGVALLLAAIGLYGVMAFQVARRTREIGVRVALGAASGDVLRLVVSDGLRLVCIGLGCGIAAAALVTRSIAGLLFDVGPRDLSIFAAVPAVLVGVGMLASYVPARRAVRVDPAVALRAD